MSKNRVDLGFLEECEPWLLVNTYFPSKVGGRPAWLDVESIPTNDGLKCAECGKQLAFLCQVYAPLDEHDICFHRTLYVFICLDAKCWKPNSSKTVKVFRCQLPQENKYYPSTPPNEDVPSEEVISSVKLCQVCGCRGPLSCAVCKSVSYCSKEHQKIDWTLGEHKTTSGNNTKSHPNNKKHKYLLDEFDLVTETEEIDEKHTSENEEDEEARRLKDYEEFVKNHEQNGSDDLANVPDEEFEKYAGQMDDDKVFHKFKKRIASDPEQIIRFDRGGSPLWITTKNQPKDDDIPPCDKCNAPRIFEFQIMPQLLNSYKDLNVDWGVMAIYTCTQSCDTNDAYVDEFCYKQDICEDSQEQSIDDWISSEVDCIFGVEHIQCLPDDFLQIFTNFFIDTEIPIKTRHMT